MELPGPAYKQELLDLIELHKPCAIAIQETKLWGDAMCNISGYTAYSKSGYLNVTAHGGVAIYARQSIPIEEIKLRTEYQAIIGYGGAEPQMLEVG